MLLHHLKLSYHRSTNCLQKNLKTFTPPYHRMCSTCRLNSFNFAMKIPFLNCVIHTGVNLSSGIHLTFFAAGHARLWHPAPLLRRPLPPAHLGSNYSVFGTTGEELWKRGSGDHPVQRAGHHLRWLCPQQQKRRGPLQGSGQPHGYERNHFQRQERVRVVTADDSASSHDAGRAQFTPKRSLHCHENRHSPHAFPAAAVPGVGYHLWKAISGAGEGCPEGVLCRQKGIPARSSAGISGYHKEPTAERLSYPKKGQVKPWAILIKSMVTPNWAAKRNWCCFIFMTGLTRRAKAGMPSTQWLGI